MVFPALSTLVTTYVLKPKLRRKVEEEYTKNPPKAYKSNNARKDVTSSTKTTESNQAIITSKKTNRNAGKQKRRG